MQQTPGPNPYAAPNPYAPPEGGYGGAPQAPYGNQGWGTPFQRLGWRTTLASLCIGGVSLGGLLVTFLTPMLDPSRPNMGVVAVIGILSLIVIMFALGAFVFYFIWIYAAATNLRALGNDLLTITPGWCIGWWFIPFASLVMCYRSMAEIARASDPDARKVSTTEWARRSTPVTVKLWWAAYLVSGLFGVVTFLDTMGRAQSHTTPSAELTPFNIVQHLFNLVAAVFVILAMRDIDRKQAESAQMLGME